jgi:hypothetical protein
VKALGKTLRLFLADGTPSGIVVAEIINWSGQIIRLPRPLLSEFLERKESSRTGIYLLVGADDEVPGRLRVYVGESDNVGSRLRQHVNSDDKSFWDFACVITSKDQNLTKAHGLFLEAKIIERALAADRATLENNKMAPYDNIPESDISDMTYFFDQIFVLLPALGVEIFSPKELDRRVLEKQDLAAAPSYDDGRSGVVDRQSPRSPYQPLTGPKAIDVVLRDSRFGIEAHGVESNGEIIVLSGSQARGVNESETNVYRSLRERLIKEGKIVATNNERILEFKTDVLFNSPSAASAVILDRNDNGRTTWKEKNSNKTLNEWYAEQANLVSQPTASGET